MSATHTFTYRAASPLGAMETGVVNAVDRNDAVQLIKARGLLPVVVSEQAWAAGSKRTVSARDLALGLRALATVLEAGLPMARALNVIDELVPNAWHRALPDIRASVRDGKSLGKALADSGLAIPISVLGIISAGEAGSALPIAVNRAADAMEAHAAIKLAIRNALAYPMLLLGVMLISIGVLVGVVLPRFATILSDLGQQLPRSTQLVLDVAQAARASAPGIALLLLLFAAAWSAWTRTSRGVFLWHSLLLRAPLVGNIRHGSASARAGAAIAALLASGVPIANALRHVQDATGDAAINSALHTAREHVLTGKRVSDAINETHAFTPTMVRLVRVGEETGRLGAMFEHAASIEAARTQQVVHNAVRLLEPALIMTFGAFVAVIAAALLQAIYSVRPVS